MDWSPISTQVNQEELNELLSTPRNDKFFHYHKWIYWTYGVATKLHRVCNKCYKKQKNRYPTNKFVRWVNELDTVITLTR